MSEPLTPAELRAARKALGLTLSRFGAFFDPPMLPTNLAAMEGGRRPITKGMSARVREMLKRLGKSTTTEGNLQ